MPDFAKFTVENTIREKQIKEIRNLDRRAWIWEHDHYPSLRPIDHWGENAYPTWNSWVGGRYAWSRKRPSARAAPTAWLPYSPYSAERCCVWIEARTPPPGWRTADSDDRVWAANPDSWHGTRRWSTWRRRSAPAVLRRRPNSGRWSTNWPQRPLLLRLRPTTSRDESASKTTAERRPRRRRPPTATRMTNAMAATWLSCPATCPTRWAVWAGWVGAAAACWASPTRRPA